LCSRPPALSLDAFGGLAVAAQYSNIYDSTIREVSPGSRVLDWGCGDGHFSHFLLEAGYRVDSFSLQDRPPLFERLSEASKTRHVFTRGSLDEPRRLPYADGAFDAAFSVGVLEHVRETGGSEAESLAEIVRVLRPGGLFLCFHLPNRSSYVEWASRLVFRDDPSDPHRRYHLYRYSRSDVRELFAAAGFRVLWHRQYGGLPRNVLARLPRPLRDNEGFTWLVNGVDRVLEGLFSHFTQNHAIVAARE